MFYKQLKIAKHFGLHSTRLEPRIQKKKSYFVAYGSKVISINMSETFYKWWRYRVWVRYSKSVVVCIDTIHYQCAKFDNFPVSGSKGWLLSRRRRRRKKKEEEGRRRRRRRRRKPTDTESTLAKHPTNHREHPGNKRKHPINHQDHPSRKHTITENSLATTKITIAASLQQQRLP